MVCLTDEERHLNPIISHHYYLGFGYTPTSSYSIFKVCFLQSCSNKSFVRYKAKNWFDMALTLSNSIDFYHDIAPCSAFILWQIKVESKNRFLGIKFKLIQKFALLQKFNLIQMLNLIQMFNWIQKSNSIQNSTF